ncbi:hypothetical protein L4C36_04595 [Photobacterium japonica]|uniref:hypothetical protein n=1 Tax=Photobacterium japonica TaxID=2910235 RepID=UPI003D0AA84F
MLELVVSNREPPSHRIQQHIADHAPEIALSALGAITGHVPYSALKNTITDHLFTWWRLSVPAGPTQDSYESTYWYLIHLLESLEEHELLGNHFVQFKVSTAAHFLLGLGDRPEKTQGIRP